MTSYSNAITKWYLTRRKESRDPFSMYSTTIITGLPAKQQRNTLGLQTYYGVFIFPAVWHRLVTLFKYVAHFQNPHLFVLFSKDYFLSFFFFLANNSELADCASFALVYSHIKENEKSDYYFQTRVLAVPLAKNSSI